MENMTLRFSDPLSLNDPFECLYGEPPEGYVRQLIELLNQNRDNKENWIRLFKERLGFPRSRALAILAAIDEPGILEMFVTETIREYIRIHPAHHEKTLHKLAICSFSENATNILMWGHYASKHTGCVIGFDLEGLNQLYPGGLFNVLYSKDRIPLPMNRNDVRETANLSVRTKSIDWKYEQEWRLIMPISVLNTNNGVLVCSFPPGIIREIILGVRVDPLLDQTARVFARKHSVGTPKKARIHPNEYRVVVGPYDDQEETP